MALVQIEEVGGVKMVGEVLSFSGCMKKINDTYDFVWGTTLALKPEQKVITSGDYRMAAGTEYESVWRVELVPNFVKNGVHYLSVYLVLAKAVTEDVKIDVFFDIRLPDTSDDFKQQYLKRGGLAQFSKDHPKFGFESYVEMIKLGPFANPKSEEKLRIHVALNIIRDDPQEETNEEAEMTPTASADPSAPPRFDYSVAIKEDAYLRFDGQLYPVDSKRIKFYTRFFDKYMFEDPNQIKKIPDMSREFDSIALFRKLLEFFSTGVVTVPKRWSGLVKCLIFSVKLEIPYLKHYFQAEVLKQLDVSKFIDVVELAKTNCLDAKEAYPIIYEFLCAHIPELVKEESYCQSYNRYEKFYQELMVNCDGAGAGDEDGEGSDSEVDHLMEYYLNLKVNN